MTAETVLFPNSGPRGSPAHAAVPTATWTAASTAVAARTRRADPMHSLRQPGPAIPGRAGDASYITPAAVPLAVAAALLAGPAAQRESGAPGLRSASLPLAFERNVGQAPAGVAFVARARRAAVLLGDDGAVLALASRDGAERVLRMRLVGAAPGPVEGADLLPGRVNHFVGSDPSAWRSGIATFA